MLFGRRAKMVESIEHHILREVIGVLLLIAIIAIPVIGYYLDKPYEYKE
jgi:hypothetical protein